MNELEEKRRIESWLKYHNLEANQNYLFVEKSIRPVMQLRGNNSPLTMLMRRPFLAIFTSNQIILQKEKDYLEGNHEFLTFMIEDIKNFEVEKLTPFHEYCISFKMNKYYYFYLDSETSFLEKQFAEKSFSVKHFEYLLEKNFFGLLS